MDKLAELKDNRGRNLLHEAATKAVDKDDARFLSSLLKLGFPLYEEDGRGELAPFIVAKIRSDGVFLEALVALIKAGFDLCRSSVSSGGQDTFVKRLCKSDHVTMAKMQAVLSARP